MFSLNDQKDPQISLFSSNRINNFMWNFYFFSLYAPLELSLHKISSDIVFIIHFMQFFIVDPHLYYPNTQEISHRKGMKMVKGILLPFKTTCTHARATAA